jgi:hypothetical protein
VLVVEMMRIDVEFITGVILIAYNLESERTISIQM